GPSGCVEQRLHGGQAVVAEFEDQHSAGLEMRRRFRDEIGVKLVAFFSAVKRDFRFMLADFAHERCSLAVANVRRIADHEIEEKWRAASGEGRGEEAVVDINFADRYEAGRG